MIDSNAAADLLLLNARCYRGNAQFHPGQSLAVWQGRILAIGAEAEIRELQGDRTVVADLGGRYLLPGLTDAHIHLSAYARLLDILDCETDSPEECLARVAVRAENTPHDRWIEGHGWDQNHWGHFGAIEELDRASGGRPTYLTARSLHAAWVSSAALAVAGISAETPDPDDGRIGRLPSGAPSGIVYEGAMRLVSRHIPRPSPAQLAESIARAQEHLWGLGITAVHDFDGRDCFLAVQDMHRTGRLGIRIVKNLLVEYLEDANNIGLQSGYGDSWLRIGQIKLFSDGALGPHTAAMLEPYLGEPDNLGILLKDEEEMLEIGIRAGQAGFGLAVHAIGDAANHAALNAFAALRREEDARGWPARRHRLEHLQLLHAADLERPARLNLIASMQPIHALSDRVTADRFWGNRSDQAYAWKSQADAGAVLAFGSDAPVESPNPFRGLAAATSRLNPSNPELPAWHPEQCLPLSAALSGYTRGPAIAAGLEDQQGSIDVGFLADLIALNKNPFQVSADELSAMLPVGVIVGGIWRVRDF